MNFNFLPIRQQEPVKNVFVQRRRLRYRESDCQHDFDSAIEVASCFSQRKDKPPELMYSSSSRNKIRLPNNIQITLVALLSAIFMLRTVNIEVDALQSHLVLTCQQSPQTVLSCPKTGRTPLISTTIHVDYLQNQQHRSGSLWSMSAGSLIASLKQQHPSMFLNPMKCNCPEWTIRSEDSTLSSFNFIDRTYQSSLADENFCMQQQSRRNRGILGFQVNNGGEEHAGDQSKKDESPVRPEGFFKKANFRISSKLNIGRGPSNVDFSSWHWPEPLSVEGDNQRTEGIDSMFLTSNDLDSVLWPMREAEISENASPMIDIELEQPETSTIETSVTGDVKVPWIPSSEQIESLTVLQLKEELGRRNMRKTGKKFVLQERFKEWVKEQHDINDEDDDDDDDVDDVNSSDTNSKQIANSLAEWVRTVDLNPLLQRRATIHKEKLIGKKFKDSAKINTMNVLTSKSPLPENYREILSKVFEKPSSPYSNLEVKQMYAAAKHADQMGDRNLAKQLLVELKDNATPHDGRVYRRLARMEQEEGYTDRAISILQEGLQANPTNAFLLHGLGQIYNKLRNYEKARDFFNKAIEADPTLPQPYHALGTMEHTLGRIAQAMKTLKKGIEYCPSNHRLHHAIGDVYRDAKLLDMATKSYNKALAFGPTVSNGFAYTALAYTAYEKGDKAQCRFWLQKAAGDNDGRHANAWVAWAQFEESEGNIDGARSVCLTGIVQYERGLLEMSRNIKLRRNNHLERNAHLENPVVLRSKLRSVAPMYRSGDRFYNVYRTWARLEERYGTRESTEDVYQRALLSFPQNWKLTLDWAQYYAKQGLEDEARVHYAKACRKAARWDRNPKPYRTFAEFEMSIGNFNAAQEILYSGATDMTSNVKIENGKIEVILSGLSELIYTWAVCEWYLDNHDRAEVLFQHVLRIVPEDNMHMRLFVLYAIARLEFGRGEYHRAQHYIGLCLKENNCGSFGAKVWSLWSDVAFAMGKERLARQCHSYSQLAEQVEEESQRIGEVVFLASSLMAGSQSGFNIAELQKLFRRDPWNTKIFGTPEQQQHAASFFYSCVQLPGSQLSRTPTKNPPL